MDVFTVQTGPGPRAAPPSAPTTARWTPPTPAQQQQQSGVSRQPSGPSPPPAYNTVDHKVYDPNSDELRDWEDRNN